MPRKRRTRSRGQTPHRPIVSRKIADGVLTAERVPPCDYVLDVSVTEPSPNGGLRDLFQTFSPEQIPGIRKEEELGSRVKRLDLLKRLEQLGCTLLRPEKWGQKYSRNL